MNEYITITVEEYEDLLESQAWLGALEAAGVDNWHGIDFAIELLHEEREEE